MRTLAVLEKSRGQLSDVSAGYLEVTLCCALGYIDLRLPDLLWREENSALVHWYGDFSRPQQSKPPSHGNSIIGIV